MSPVYNSGLETIETVYTYEEWLKEYNRRVLWFDYDGYWNHYAFYFRRRRNGFTVCVAAWNIFITDKGKSYNILRKGTYRYD